MRWLLIKDLQILRRSPLLVGLLIVYPIAIALMIGFALSSPPGKPTVAFYDQVAPGGGASASATSRSTSPTTPADCSRSVHALTRALARRKRWPTSAAAARWPR